MNSKPDIEIHIPQSYSQKQTSRDRLSVEEPKITDIPNAINKVRVKRIRGVLKDDSSFSK